MDRIDNPDFLISNHYGKVIHLKIEFEYLDESGFSAESDPLIVKPNEQKPIVFRQLLIKSLDNISGPIDLSLLNLKHIIISAWVPGSELKDLSMEAPLAPVHPPEKLHNDKPLPNTSWNPLGSGWNILTGAWNSFMKKADGSESPPTGKEEVSEETQPHVQLEGCAALLFLDHINVVRIIDDPLRNLPQISAEKIKFNRFH